MRSETEALLLYLALAQKDCPEEVIMKLTGRVVLPRHHSESCICQGTGKVARFPGLRVDCSNTGQICPVNLGSSPQCSRCQGRGWVVAHIHLEDLLAIGFEVFQCGIDFQPTTGGECVVSLSVGGNISEKAPSPFLALLQCIVAAVKEEKP